MWLAQPVRVEAATSPTPHVPFPAAPGMPARAGCWESPAALSGPAPPPSSYRPTLLAIGGHLAPGPAAVTPASFLFSLPSSTKGTSVWAAGKSCAWGHLPTYSRRARAGPERPPRAPAMAKAQARAPRPEGGRAAAEHPGADSGAGPGVEQAGGSWAESTAPVPFRLATVPESLQSPGEPQKALPCHLQVGALARRTRCLVGVSEHHVDRVALSYRTKVPPRKHMGGLPRRLQGRIQ